MIRHHVAMMIAAASTLAAPAAAQNGKPTTSFTGSLGYLSASGNTRLTTLSIGEALGHTHGRWALSQRTAYVYGKTSTRESANQLRSSVRTDFAFEPRLGLFGGVSFERNRYAGFKRRIEEIAGLKWKAVAAPADSVNLDAGGVRTRQANVDGSSPMYSSARAAVAYKHVFSKAAYLQQLAEFVPNLLRNNEYRLYAESAVVAPISTHVGVKVNYSVRYDSAPPVTFGTTDRVLTMGVQLSY